jgi:hypothetical protein
MNPNDLMELLFIAANARTEEEKARVVWRANDYMWMKAPHRYSLGFCRDFNNLCQDQRWPWIDNLWSKEERELMQKEMKKTYGSAL